jgi:hypothetical protein
MDQLVREAGRGVIYGCRDILLRLGLNNLFLIVRHC